MPALSYSPISHRIPLFGFLHLVFDFIEVTVDELVEYIFQMDHHQSEIVGIYNLLFIFVIFFIRVFRRMPAFITRQQNKLIQTREARMNSFSDFWMELPWQEKI